ncbi:hypothetical protein E2F50_15500 [Rhizobium deserti]|uniref:Uncharacterized protein n=1 Tax=Rhizobium deserti TaxID=2547961 RepID=A0A4R5UID2_9HYPH|nr:hypothetical protein [Rhizobium deserti]TDK35626.1 hypothetical protein E2F50_15500 [Rhizobium deserti]
MTAEDDRLTGGAGSAGGIKNVDAVPPGTPDAAENLCRRCAGTGTVEDGECPECGGSGKVLTPVGGAG